MRDRQGANWNKKKLVHLIGELKFFLFWLHVGDRVRH